MKLYKKIIYIAIIALLIGGCSDFLDRPPLTSANDETIWTSEENIRLYVNKYYPTFFVGYGVGWTNDEAPILGFTFSDDVVHNGTQGNFTRSVPNSQIWSMTLIRSINIMLERVENQMKNKISEDAYNHWIGIGRFFRAMRYSQLVLSYGDVPYYDHVVSDTDLDDLYKPRTSRNEVMDAVYDDLKFALDNVYINDGDQNVNRYVVAGFITRLALFEGTWQKYYYANNDQAKKFLNLAKEAGDYVINSNKFDIVTEFRELFVSESLKGNPDCILYRHYDPAVGVTHSVASYNNISESLNYGATTDLIKSFICNDGNVWQNSSLENASNFEIKNMFKTRDPRLEATFYDKPHQRNKGSFWYTNKFFPRSAAKIVETTGAAPEEFTSTNNRTDYPVLRYAEVLLNWIEAKAELSTLGDNLVAQDDIDKSINKIRNRPLAEEAVAMGVKKTAPMDLANLPDDPNRDSDVPVLIWEIRRERRMEFVFEYSRYQDLRRWKKLNYMDTDANEDLFSGGWVDFPSQMSSELTSANTGKISVVTMDHDMIIYNGSNDAQMKGFFRSVSTRGRQPFLNLVNVNPYLAPVGKTQIDDYLNKGYSLSQTEGWPQN